MTDRLTTAEIVELIMQGEKVDVEFTHDHAGTIVTFDSRAITVDPGKRELVFSTAKARQVGEAFIAWAEAKESRQVK